MNTVIFDIGNVLVDFTWEPYLASFSYSPQVYETVADAMFRSREWEIGDSGLASTEEWLGRFISNAPEYEEQIREVFANFGGTIIPRAITSEWISYFRGRGCRIYYLSNYSEELYRQSKEKLAFIDTFDGGIFSFKEQLMKPQPEIYERLLTRYQIAPEDAVFYDDRAENVVAAQKLGIEGVVFTPDIPLQMLLK